MGSIHESPVSTVFREAGGDVPDSSNVKQTHFKYGNDQMADIIIKANKDHFIYDTAIGSFWVYEPKTGIWEAKTDWYKVHQMIAVKLAELKQRNTTHGKIEDIAKQMKLHAKDVHDLDEEFLSFSDVSLNLYTGETAEHSPYNVATLHIPVPYSSIAGAESPMFDRYLKETCVDEDGVFDPGMRDQLQEFAGYLLWPKLEVGPCVFFYGDGSNGKSVFIDVMKGLVGKSRTGSSGLENLIGNRFGMASLAGIRFNTSDELGNCREATTADFKKMVFGDTVRCERKFGDPFDLVPKAKFIFSTNTIPAFSEVNTAMRRRILIIPFWRKLDPFSAADRKKTVFHLGHKIVKEELPGVVRWAMEGLERLKANGFWFTRTPASEAMMNRFEEASSSVIEFLNECYEEAENGMMTVEQVYDEYVCWTKLTGRKAVSRNGFGKDASAKFGRPKQKSVNGKVVRVYAARQKSQIPKLPVFS